MRPAYARSEHDRKLSVHSSTLVSMAFATEHPVLAHSEYRPAADAVTGLVRTGARFEVVSEYAPAGDQPAAIDELERRILKRLNERATAPALSVEQGHASDACLGVLEKFELSEPKHPDWHFLYASQGVDIMTSIAEVAKL